MRILGLNGGFALPLRDGGDRHPLDDGAAALLVDGVVACAAIEERLTRHRYVGGFRHSAPLCLAAGRTGWEALDGVAFSTCCERRWTRPEDVVDELRQTFGGRIHPSTARVLTRRVAVVDHHESHAALAFAASGAARALVAVLDGLGNRRDGSPPAPRWQGAFQRHSYYLASWSEAGMELELVDEDCGGQDEAGIGEVYRALTHFAGWRSYHQAGTTMALAGFGDPRRAGAVEFVSLRDGEIVVPVASRYTDPEGLVLEVLRRAGVRLSPCPPSAPATPADRALCDVVAALQAQVEHVLRERLAALCDRHGVSDLCLGGGVALNCLAMGRLSAALPGIRVSVSPAPGDTGQSLGNALWAACSRHSPLARPGARRARPSVRSGALGFAYPPLAYRRAAERLAGRRGVRVYGPFPMRELARGAAELLEAGIVVATRGGRGEYGPRALGQSSVLADSRRAEMRDRVNDFKRREAFRPYAPCVLAEHAAEYFHAPAESPFMSFAAAVREERCAQVPAVLHVDATARYQTVAADGPVFLRAVLEEFYARTGVPVLVNTSFNRAGEPIVETPDDAARCFADSALPALCLGPYLGVKSR